MKQHFSKEWHECRINQEGDSEVGAGQTPWWAVQAPMPKLMKDFLGAKLKEGIERMKTERKQRFFRPIKGSK